MSHWTEKYNTENSWDMPFQEHWLVRLWRAILHRALEDLTNNQCPKAYRDAKAWINSTAKLSTFNRICVQVLNLEEWQIYELRNYAAKSVYNGPPESKKSILREIYRRSYKNRYVKKGRLKQRMTREERNAKARAAYRALCDKQDMLKLKKSA